MVDSLHVSDGLVKHGIKGVKVRQTAIIRMLTALIHLVRNSNLRVWDASVPDRLDASVEVLGEVWPPAVGKWVNFERPILHLMAHWRQQYTALGTPVQWTTKDFIEAMQRILRAAYLRTNLNEVEPQIMGQLMPLKYVDTVIEPSLRERSGEHGDSDEDDDRPPRVAALQNDRATQAYLRGATVKAVPGFNTVFGDPADHAEDSWNAGMRKASAHAPRCRITLGFLTSARAPASILEIPASCAAVASARVAYPPTLSSAFELLRKHPQSTQSSRCMSRCGRRRGGSWRSGRSSSGCPVCCRVTEQVLRCGWLVQL